MAPHEAIAQGFYTVGALRGILHGAYPRHPAQFLAACSHSHILHHHTERIYVSPGFGYGTLQKLLRGKVSVSACRHLQHSEEVAVGKSEVYYLHVLPHVCHHDVRRFYVAVYNLLAVHIIQCVHHLRHYSEGKF